MDGLERISSASLRPAGGLRRGLLSCFLLVCIGGTAGAAPDTSTQDGTASPLDLEALFAQFASMPGFSAHFREEKHLVLLREPLVSRGVVYFAPPHLLVRHTEEPVPSTLLVEEHEISFGGAGEVRSLDLDASPALRALVDGIRLVLAGDVEGLRASFRIGFRAPGEADRSWRIDLAPRDPALGELIVSISIQGRGRTPRQLRVVERSGDETVTQFSEVETDRAFSKIELARLFRVSAR